MEISVDGQVILELTDVQKKVICNDIHEDLFDEDMKRRLKYILEHKYEQCFKRLKKAWDDKLSSRLDSIPTNPDSYAQLVFSQPDYEDFKTKDNREKAEAAVKEKAKE